MPGGEDKFNRDDSDEPVAKRGGPSKHRSRRHLWHHRGFRFGIRGRRETFRFHSKRIVRCRTQKGKAAKASEPNAKSKRIDVIEALSSNSSSDRRREGCQSHVKASRECSAKELGMNGYTRSISQRFFDVAFSEILSKETSHAMSQNICEMDLMRVQCTKYEFAHKGLYYLLLYSATNFQSRSDSKSEKKVQRLKQQITA